MGGVIQGTLKNLFIPEVYRELTPSPAKCHTLATEYLYQARLK
jgi:hypothetical protein